MSKLTPRQRRHQVTKQAILLAARRIIAEEGLSGLSMRAIAEKIDYSTSGLYEYFAAKEDIMAELRAEGFERLGNDLAQLDQALPPDQRLVEAGLVYLRFQAAHPELYYLMFSVPLGQRLVADEEKAQAVFNQLEQIIQDGVSQAVFKAHDDAEVKALVYGCWAQVHGIATLRQGMPEEQRNFFDQASRNILERQAKGLQL